MVSAPRPLGLLHVPTECADPYPADSVPFSPLHRCGSIAALALLHRLHRRVATAPARRSDPTPSKSEVRTLAQIDRATTTVAVATTVAQPSVAMNRRHAPPSPDTEGQSQASGAVAIEAAVPVEPAPSSPIVPATAVSPSSPSIAGYGHESPQVATAATTATAAPPAPSSPHKMVDSRRGSLSALRAADASTSKPLKPTSTFPLPQAPVSAQAAGQGRDSPSSPFGQRAPWPAYTRSPKEPSTPAPVYSNSNGGIGAGSGGGSSNGISVSMKAVSAPSSVSLSSVPPPINTHVWPYAPPPAVAGSMSLGDSMLPPAALAAPASPSRNGGGGGGGVEGQRNVGTMLHGHGHPTTQHAHIPPLPPLRSQPHDFPSFLSHQQYQLQLQQFQAQQHAQQARGHLFAPAPQHPAHPIGQYMQDEAGQQQQQQQYWDHVHAQQQHQQLQQHALLSQHMLVASDPVCDANEPPLMQQHWDAYRRSFVPSQPPPPPSAAGSAMSVASASASASPPSGSSLHPVATPLYNSSASRDSLDGEDGLDDDEEDERGEEEEEEATDSDDSEGVAVRGRGRGRVIVRAPQSHNPSRNRAISSSSESMCGGSAGGGGGAVSDDAHSQEREERFDALAMHGFGAASASAVPPSVAAHPNSLQVPFASLMRKAQSAADFKTFSSRSRGSLAGGRGGRGGAGAGGNGAGDLGVLTPFYSSETGTFVGSGSHGPSGGGAGLPGGLASASRPLSGGGSGNASSSSLHTLRASTSHALLSGGGGGSASSGPPLVAHFSLSSGPKSNGQPRGQRSELAMVTEKLREMSYEVSRLHRKIRESEEDQEQWSLRYARRIVVLSNVALGCWIFLLQLAEGMRSRAVRDGWLQRLFIPAPVLRAAARGAAAAAAAGPALGAAGAAGSGAAHAAAHGVGLALGSGVSVASSSSSSVSTPLSAVLISGLLSGVSASLPFLLSGGLQTRTASWKRNAGFLLSTFYSLYLLILRRRDVRPPAANVINILANLFYVAARYYFLHGLLVFNSMRIL